MKTRLKSIITSIIGIVIMIAVNVMFFFGDLIVNEYEMSLTTYLTIMFLGYVFLIAKNSLIEGIFLNLLKIKK